jgi:hypothetical protein
LETLEEFRVAAERDRRVALLDAFPMEACAATLRHSWREFTVSLYRQWLTDAVGTVAADVSRAAIFGEVG